MKYVVAMHPIVAAQDICRHIVAAVTHAQTIAGWVRKKVEYVRFRALVGWLRAIELIGFPALGPLGLKLLWIVAFIHRMFLADATSSRNPHPTRVSSF